MAETSSGGTIGTGGFTSPPGNDKWSDALGRLPSGLFILTAGEGTQETGMLASWVQQCSFDPPSVSVAIKPDRAIYESLVGGASFVLNLLAEGDKKFLSHFGKGFAPGEPAFASLNVERLHGGGIVLVDALGHLQCRVVARYPAGDHDLVVGTIVGGKLHHTESKPYVHVRKSGLRY